MKNKCLSEDEESKIDRLSTLLFFIGKTEVINFVINGPFRFTAATGAFTDNLTDRTVSPNVNLINLFYKRLCRDALGKLESDLRRSKIKGLRRLLISFYKLDFLPLAY